MSFVAQNIAPIMFVGLVFFLMLGFPVAFSLAACGLMFGFVGIELDLLPASLFQALPLRMFGIMQNDTLLAIPFFTFMGLVLERSGMAEDLLDTVGQLFGPVRGGLAFAVIFVGALLAATTGVVAASVISMGLISLPIMLRYGYDRRVACGSIAASGTLAQIIPPSIVLIVLADQLGRSVGDMYRGAFIPGFILTGLYLGYIVVLTIIKPKWVPALPPEARTIREPDGASGLASLGVLALISIGVAYGFEAWYRGHYPKASVEELVVLMLMASIGMCFVLAMLNRLFKLGLLSRMAERVTFVLIPPLALIFLVLGTIFLGIATPTEGGAMGAMGALVMALSRRRLTWSLMKQAMDTTAKLSTFVVFILIGSTVFNLTFQGVDGSRWVEHLLTDLPGGATGFLIVVNVMVFVLAFFLDFFELAFIIVPLLAPVAEKVLPTLGVDASVNSLMIWFGVLLAVNMQTSFMHPPFGFALFYLRSVAPQDDYVDKITNKPVARITTMQIYWGSVPFVCIQIVMVALLITLPELVIGTLDREAKVDLKNIKIEIPSAMPAQKIDPMKGFEIPRSTTEADSSKAAEEQKAEEREDPNEAILRSLRQGQKK
jgi:TRAP-type mannitol/chloroaromatic compound transport system permease large subunit